MFDHTLKTLNHLVFENWYIYSLVELWKYMKYLVFLLLLVANIQVNCQPNKIIPQPSFQNYTTDEGLPSNEVYKAEQDHLGYMWFATDYGVSKFDGTIFKNYTKKDGLTDNCVLYFYNDSFGRRWCITLNNQLCYFENDSIYTYAYNDTVVKYLKNSTMMSFFVDSTGRLYCGSRKNGLVIISKDGQCKHLGYNETSKNLLEVEDKGVLYYGTTASRSNVHQTKDKINHKYDLKITLGKKEKYIGVTKIDQLKKRFNTSISILDNNYLFSFRNALIHINENLDTNTILFKESINTITVNQDSSIWLGFFKKGAMLFSTNEWPYKEKQHVLKDLSITDISRDNTGGWWFTTLEEGIFYTPNLTIQSLHKRLPHKQVCSITGTKSDIYIGFGNGIVSKLDNDYNLDNLYSSTGNYVLDIFVNSDQSKMYSGGKKVICYDIEKRSYQDVSKVASGSTAMCMDSSDNLYMVGNYGLFKYKNGELVYSYSFINEGKSINTKINALYMNKNGKLLAGTRKGLYEFYDNNWHYLGNSDSLLQLRIDAITKFKNGIVLGTKGHGILYWKEGYVKQYTTIDGLPDNGIKSLYAKDNHLWVGTSNGLCRIETDTIGEWKFKCIKKEHGLLSNTINCIYERGEKLWIGSNKGVTIMNLEELKLNTLPPKVFLNNVYVNQQIQAVKKSNYSYQQNSFQFDFVGINYRTAGKVAYRYRMIGLDKQWIYTTNSKAIFQELRPGNYTFEVSAQNENGIWSIAPLSYQFVIDPPFWKTLTFRFIVAVSLIMLFYMLFRIHVLTYNRDVTRELLQSLVEFFKKKGNSESPFILVKSVQDGHQVKISIASLLWIKSSGNYVEVFTERGKVLARAKMKELENQLTSISYIIRIHRSYIVNLEKAHSFNLNEIKLNNETIPIGRNYKSNIKSYKESLGKV